MLVFLFSQDSEQSVSIVWFLSPVLYFESHWWARGTLLSLRELGFASTSEEKGVGHVDGHIHALILLLFPFSSRSLSTNSSEKQGTQESKVALVER